MVDDYNKYSQKKQLNGEIRKETKVVKKFVSKVLTIIFSITFVVALVLGSAIIFHNVYYQSFFVNGQSMYPTLNGNATYSNGELIGYNQLPKPADGNVVEYGIMDMHQRAIDKINRFDIIVVAYSDSETSDKIKRVIALPGEEFYFVATSKNHVNNGDLYVRYVGNDDFTFVEQNFGDEELLRAREYAGGKIPNKHNPLTLAEDEYYVLGDNRAHSHDSAAVGPVSYTNIKGVAIAIEGVCTLVYQDGSYQAENILFHWPHLLKWKDV